MFACVRLIRELRSKRQHGIGQAVIPIGFWQPKSVPSRVFSGTSALGRSLFCPWCSVRPSSRLSFLAAVLQPTRSTIGFAKPRASIGSPGDIRGGGNGGRPRTEPGRNEGVDKRKASSLKIKSGQMLAFRPRKIPHAMSHWHDWYPILCTYMYLKHAFFILPQASTESRLSPSHPSPLSRNAGTPSTISTSPGESRGWTDARVSALSMGDDAIGNKRPRIGGTSRPPLPPSHPSPQQGSLPQEACDPQAPQRAPTGFAPGASKGMQNQPRRGSRGKDGTGSPSHAQVSSGKAGLFSGGVVPGTDRKLVRNSWRRS